LSTYLIEDLGLSSKILAYDLVGTGCGGSLPNLQLASHLCSAHPGSIAVSIAIEICTATFQMGNDTSLIISNSIFGDGAAAAVVWDRPSGIGLIASSQSFLPEYRNDVRYVHKGGQLHNKLSKRLSEIIGDQAAVFVKDLLNKNNLSQDEIDHYFIHTGGSKILDACAKSLSLDEEKMKISRTILLEYGNMSSPSLLFELDRMYDQIKKDQWCLMLGFGAGLSMYGWLLRGR
jgi:predicted naringenin-chalcone synthase